MNRLAIACIALALACAAAALAWRQGLLRLPPAHDPWASLSLDEPPGWTTRWKLARVSRDPALCRAALAQARWRTTPVADRSDGTGCGLRDAVRIDAMRLRVGRPFVLSCPAAVSLALWEQHEVLPAARRHFGRAVTGLEHFGSDACRDVRGRVGGPRSRHATADALDVAAVVLEGGRRVSIAADWRADGPEAAFLRDLHRGACRWFDVVLGPDHDTAHADHLHVDRGTGRACR